MILIIVARAAGPGPNEELVKELAGAPFLPPSLSSPPPPPPPPPPLYPPTPARICMLSARVRCARVFMRVFLRVAMKQKLDEAEKHASSEQSGPGTHSHALPPLRAPPPPHAATHPRTCSHTVTHTHGRTHTNTHTLPRSCTHTHTNTHTFTLAPLLLYHCPPLYRSGHLPGDCDCALSAGGQLAVAQPPQAVAGQSRLGGRR